MVKNLIEGNLLNLIKVIYENSIADILMYMRYSVLSP